MPYPYYPAVSALVLASACLNDRAESVALLTAEKDDDDDAVWRNALKAKAANGFAEQGGDVDKCEPSSSNEEQKHGGKEEEKKPELSSEQRGENSASMQRWRQHVLRARAALERAKATAEDARKNQRETERLKEEHIRRLGERKRQLELIDTAYKNVKERDVEKKTQDMRDVARRIAGRMGDV